MTHIWVVRRQTVKDASNYLEYIILVIEEWMVEWFWHRKAKYSQKTWSSATLSTKNPTWIRLGLNSDLHGESPANKCLGAATENIVASFRWKLAKIHCRGLYTVFIIWKLFKIITLGTAGNVASHETCLSQSALLRPLRRHRHGQVSQGIRQIAGQLLYRGELRNGRKKFSLHPVLAAFRSTPFCSCTSPISCFILSPTSFDISALTLKLLWLGRGGILKVCAGPYFHDKDHATKLLSTDVLLFWENAWRNSGTIATILTTLLRVFLSLSTTILKDTMTSSCICYTHFIIFFPVIRLHINSAVRTTSLNDQTAISKAPEERLNVL